MPRPSFRLGPRERPEPPGRRQATPSDTEPARANDGTAPPGRQSMAAEGWNQEGGRIPGARAMAVQEDYPRGRTTMRAHTLIEPLQGRRRLQRPLFMALFMMPLLGVLFSSRTALA